MTTQPYPVTASEAAQPRAPRRRLPRRRLLAAAGLLALLALVAASCKQLDPANRAASVPGVTNGALPISYLASTTSGCVVYDEAITSLNAMVEAAARDGVKLRPLSCYRDYAGQVSVRADWCSRGACHMAAVPGTSNHGWGKAVDFRDQTGELDFDSPGYLWMKAWAGFYGWFHPSSMEQDGPVPEAWHWEWVGDGGKMFLGEYFGIGNAPLAEPRGLPMGALDLASGGSGTVTVAGWAIDPDQVSSIPVHVYIDSAGFALDANQRRPDVADAYPLYAGANHGFTATLPAAPGVHNVCAYALNVTGTGHNRLLRCATVTVGAPAAPAVAPPSTAPTTTAPSTTTTVPSSTTTSTTSTTTPPSSTTTSTAAMPMPTTTGNP